MLLLHTLMPYLGIWKQNNVLLKSLFKRVANLADAEILLFTCAVTKINLLYLQLYVVLSSVTAFWLLESLVVTEHSFLRYQSLEVKEAFPIKNVLYLFFEQHTSLVKKFCLIIIF